LGISNRKAYAENREMKWQAHDDLLFPEGKHGHADAHEILAAEAGKKTNTTLPAVGSREP
jgi:hypothetical protein